MAIYWGVDSFNPASTRLGVKGHPTLFEHVCDIVGGYPAFWGRYITKAAGGTSLLTRKEIDYIFSASGGVTSILPIYNGAHNAPGSTRGGRREGEKDAQKAISAAGELSIPNDVFIWCDIEPGWKCTAEWFAGWWHVMIKSPYGGAGGMYENPLPWNAVNFAKPYVKAVQANPDIPANYRLLWAQQPCKQNIKLTPWPSEFAPTEPKGERDTTVLWQYAIDCLHTGGKWGNVDLNMASELGYATMWSGTAGGPRYTPKSGGLDSVIAAARPTNVYVEQQEF